MNDEPFECFLEEICDRLRRTSPDPYKEASMPKPGPLVLFLMFLAFPLAAQTIRGRVTLQGDGSPLPGVTVSIDELGLTTITDGDGRYALTLPATRPGEVKVTASLPGF